MSPRPVATPHCQPFHVHRQPGASLCAVRYRPSLARPCLPAPPPLPRDCAEPWRPPRPPLCASTATRAPARLAARRAGGLHPDRPRPDLDGPVVREQPRGVPRARRLDRARARRQPRRSCGEPRRAVGGGLCQQCRDARKVRPRWPRRARLGRVPRLPHPERSGGGPCEAQLVPGGRRRRSGARADVAGLCELGRERQPAARARRAHFGWAIPGTVDEALARSRAVLASLEARLAEGAAAGEQWAASSAAPTAADVAVFPHVALAETSSKGAPALGAYPAVCAWIRPVRTLPGFGCAGRIFLGREHEVPVYRIRLTELRLSDLNRALPDPLPCLPLSE